MQPIDKLIPPDWLAALEASGARPAIEKCLTAVDALRASGVEVYPREELTFNALWATPLERVRCILLGQDPYINPGQAMGLSFSVPQGVAFPPSLRNIFIELQREYGGERRTNSDLSDWASQGVLLLNSILTVTAGDSGSHASLGWQPITRKIVALALQTTRPQVLLLWGRFAKGVVEGMDTSGKFVLTAAHPVAPTNYNAFLGCGHFQLANKWLVKQGAEPIRWV